MDWSIDIVLELCEMIWVDEGVGIDKVFWEIRVPSYTVVDHFMVEMLHYILQSLFRVSKVPVMKIRCGEIRWWWVLNRKECVFLRSGWPFLQLGIVFQIILWWFFSFGNLFQRLWHCFFQGSGILAGVSCSYSTPEFCSGWILDKVSVNRRGETLLVQVCYLRCAWGYQQWPLLIMMELQGSKY